jgi:hypothetical protein
MTAPVSRPTGQPVSPGRLSAGRYGKGLDDVAWAPILEIGEHVMPDALRALANAGAPGYAAPAHPPGYRLRDRSQRPETYRLWAGASAHGRTEDVLAAAMARPVREAARSAGSAWR